MSALPLLIQSALNRVLTRKTDCNDRSCGACSVCVLRAAITEALAAPSPSRDQGTSDAQIAVWERLANEASPGTWIAFRDGDGVWHVRTEDGGIGYGVADIPQSRLGFTSPRDRAEARFIAAAKVAVPALIALVRSERAARAEAERERDEALSRAEAAADSASRFWLTEYRERVAAAVRRAEAAEHDRDEAREALDEDRHWLVASQGWLEAAQRRAEAAEAREREVREALRPFAAFDFGPNWIGHQFIERDGDTVVLCGYDGNSKTTGVDVKFSDFERARALAASPSRKGDATAPYFLADGSTVMLPVAEVERRRKAAAVVIEEARRIVNANWIAHGEGTVGGRLARAFAALDAPATPSNEET